MRAATQATMAQLIRAELEHQGLTQAEFARRVGCSQKHLSLVLNGKAGALAAQLDYWAFVLGCHWTVKLEKSGA